MLYQELRLRAARTAFRSAQVSILREHLMKLRAWVESSVRRIVLHLISPIIWRRFLVRSDCTIADLHYTL